MRRIILCIRLCPPSKSAPPGVAFHLVLRIALEICATAKEAARFMQEIPHLDASLHDVDEKNMYAMSLPGIGESAGRDRFLAVTNHYKTGA